MAVGVVVILVCAFVYGISRLPSAELNTGTLSRLAGAASGTAEFASVTGSATPSLPFSIASLAATLGIPAEFPEPSSGAVFAPIATHSAPSVPVATAAAASAPAVASSAVAASAVVASAVPTAPVGVASPTASATVQPGRPGKATDSIRLTTAKPKLPDLEALGYRLHGIIHRSRGRSSVFIFDPVRGKEVVVTAGASDPIKLLEVSDRRVVILTQKGSGTLRLGDAGAPPSKPVSTPTPSSAGGKTPDAAAKGGTSTASGTPPISGTLASAVASEALTAATVPGLPTQSASAPARPFAGIDPQQLMKAGALEAKQEGGRWYAVVGKVASDSPLAKAGLAEGDKIETIGQSGFSHGAQIPALLERWGGGGQDDKITVIRKGSSIQWKAGETPPDANQSGIPRVDSTFPPPRPAPPAEPLRPFGTVPPPVATPTLPPGVIPPFGGGKPPIPPQFPKPATGYGQQGAR